MMSAFADFYDCSLVASPCPDADEACVVDSYSGGLAAELPFGEYLVGHFYADLGWSEDCEGLLDGVWGTDSDPDADADADFSLCSDECIFSGDGECDDGGYGASFSACELGSDCTDCGIRPVLCSEECTHSDDGECDDGGYGASFSVCELGSDCTDCGYRTDIDGDGYGPEDYSGEDGGAFDCDDSDPDISPSATEYCDGIDNNCDGIIDELTDTLEPNDSYSPVDLGELDEEGDTLSTDTYMTHEDDEDAFSFYLHDRGDGDDYQCTITPPASVDIAIDLYYEESLVGTVDAGGVGAAESLTYGGTLETDDSGMYTLVLTTDAGTHSCDAPISIDCVKSSF
jgi:hypothetical protein